MGQRQLGEIVCKIIMSVCEARGSERRTDWSTIRVERNPLVLARYVQIDLQDAEFVVAVASSRRCEPGGRCVESVRRLVVKDRASEQESDAADEKRSEKVASRAEGRRSPPSQLATQQFHLLAFRHFRIILLILSLPRAGGVLVARVGFRVGAG